MSFILYYKYLRNLLDNEYFMKISCIFIIYVIVNGFYITSYALTQGDIIDYYKESNMITINNTKIFIHNIRDIEEITSNSINIHTKILV